MYRQGHMTLETPSSTWLLTVVQVLTVNLMKLLCLLGLRFPLPSSEKLILVEVQRDLALEDQENGPVR